LKNEVTAGVSYTYDRWGNMTQINSPLGTEFAQVQTDGQGNPTNRYATINGYTQVYDAAGNLTDDATYLYKYDAAGRMREVVQKAGNILLQKFWYDHAGQRMKKEDRPQGGTAHWYYCLWSGNQVIAEFQALVGTTFNPGTTPEQAASTDTLADLRYQHTDIRSVRLITDGTGLQVDTQAHTPHGGVVDGGGQARTFFTTYEREMSGLDYARARYYRSSHRRFTSADPYGGSYRRGNPQSLNRYAYVGNDPINWSDPSGELRAPPTVIIVITEVDLRPVPPRPIRGIGDADNGGGSQGGSTLEQLFNKCVQEHGDKYWKENLKFNEYLTASLAATAVGIDEGIILAIWWIESKFDSNVNLRGAAGEVGPLQIRPQTAIAELRWLRSTPWGRNRLNLLDRSLANYRTSLYDNLLAGAFYYRAIQDHVARGSSDVPVDQIAAAYNGGPDGYTSAQAQEYQRFFNQQLEVWKKIAECIKNGVKK
jgi:RHS repeat-associated protein